jgi:hypothetical protein
MLLLLFKKGSAHMQVIIGIIGVLGAAATIMIMSEMDIVGGVKAVIITMAVLIAVYCMARIQPKESKPETDSGK